MYNEALKYLRTNEVLHMGMIFPILRGTAEFIYVDNDGVFLKEVKSNSFMLSISNLDKGKKLIDSEGDKAIYCMYQKSLADYLMKKHEYQNQLVCFQAVYFEKEHITGHSTKLSIRQLGLEYIDTILEHYHEDYQYIKHRLECGGIYGGFLGDELCGFVGTHEEGSIGILEIFPQYRRRGFGEELESHLINLILDEGHIPFAQISVDNEASIKLQMKLGLTISSDTLCWLF